MQFKTNINCGNCVAKVSKSLNEAIGEDNWKVDTDNPAKILTVLSENATAETVVAAVKKVGFKAEAL